MPTARTVDKKTRQEIESLIYKVYDTVDKTHTNSDYYKNLFSKMSDEEFYKFFERRLPLRFHEDAFKIQPKMYKRMKQMLSKKNNASMRVGKRDMRTGLLLQEDKAAKETDREFESLASYGLDYTMDEFRTVKADAMQASAEMIATIVDKGSVSQEDYAVTKVDGLARNMLNVYLLGAGVYSNLIDREYMTPLTAKNKTKKIERM